MIASHSLRAGLAGIAVVLGLGAAPVSAQERSGRTPPAADTSALVPLDEMGQRPYRGESGGLYGGGRNQPPEALRAAARAAAGEIRPRDAEGRPDPAGRIVLLSLGMSNTGQAFQSFQRLAAADREVSPAVVLVNGAQGGADAARWAAPDGANPQGVSVWEEVDRRLQQAGVTPRQVQAVWIKHAHANPAQYGSFPAHARRLQADLATLLRAAASRFPHLRIAYLSSRTYAGYARGPLNPEPYAYEGAFAVRWLIEAQATPDPKSRAPEEATPGRAPVLLWGPYLWANGARARRSDGLQWLPGDVNEKDGVHESPAGQRKAGDLLLRFFRTDESARGWFLRGGGK